MSGAATQIEIGALALELPQLPGIDPGLFARHLELGLGRLVLHGGNAAAIARIEVPPVAARAGDTPVTLAQRVCAAIAGELRRQLDGRAP